MKLIMRIISFVVIFVFYFTSSYALPVSWNYTVTYNSHVILIQPNIPLTINGIQIEAGDYIGVFYPNSFGGLNCGGYIEFQGVLNSINAWTEDLGDDGFESGDAFVWKIWDSSTNTEYITEAQYDNTGIFTHTGFFSENGMSGLISLMAISSTVPWNYAITGTNHTILIPNNALLTIDNLPISHGDYLGVFYDSAGTLNCGGYVEWLGFTTSISAWGEDLGDDGFITGEEFTWKIWDKSEDTELISQAFYITGSMPNQGNFTINGMSGIDSLKYISTPWNYTITATNHTILIPEDGTYLINNTPISIGDYIGVFYDSLGILACAGYSVWEGYNTSIAAWGEDLGNDGFIVGEEFKWKVWDVSDGVEYYASAIYLGSPLPHQGNYIVNGMSGVDSLLIIDNPPNWNFSITSNNHTILIPDFGDYSTLNGPIELGDFIGVFYDSLGTLSCGGYVQWFGLLTTIAAWGEDAGNDGFTSGEEFFWKIWNTSTGTEFDVVADYILPPSMPNTNQYLSNGMSGIISLEVVEPSPSWTYLNTGSNHTILIPENIDILIDNNQIVPGDYLGVFYDSIGTIVCAGYVEYTGTTDALTAWGEDLGFDGFTIGEEFNWKIWDASEDSVWDVFAIYDLTFPQQQFYTENGISSLSNLTSAIPSETQYITLNQGWGIYSTYINPYVSDMDSLFSDIIQFTIMCKDANGFIFWPAFNVNLIGNIAIGEGYLIKMSDQQILSITGDLITPETTGIALNSGWDMIAYLRKTPASIIPIMNPIVNSIQLVKDGDGNIYWPQYFLNLIGNMYPGQGYQIKMNNSEVLYYPANTVNIAKNSFTPLIENNQISNTGRNMTLAIPLATLPFETNYSLANIKVFDQSGLCVGYSKFTGNNIALSLWGDDLLTSKKDGLADGEEFIIKTDNGETIFVKQWITGSSTYSDNKISITDQVEFEFQDNSFSIIEVYPNPTTNTSFIKYFLPTSGNVNISVYNIIGERLLYSGFDNQLMGINTYNFNRNNLAEGKYIIRINYKDKVKSVLINIM